MRVGPDTRQNLDAPRIAVSVDAGGRALTGHELARRLSDDRRTRTDDFTFDRTTRPTSRVFATVSVTIDGQPYALRVPSSLLVSGHGRTDPGNKQWMTESR